MLEKWYRSFSLLAFYNFFTGTGGGGKISPSHFIIIYNYFTGKLRKFYFTKGSRDQLCLHNIKSAARDVFQKKLVDGGHG